MAPSKMPGRNENPWPISHSINSPSLSRSTAMSFWLKRWNFQEDNGTWRRNETKAKAKREEDAERSNEKEKKKKLNESFLQFKRGVY